jgi:hypothetical protein
VSRRSFDDDAQDVHRLIGQPAHLQHVTGVVEAADRDSGAEGIDEAV